MSVKATVFGAMALLMWATIVGMVRSVTEAFGVEVGTALIYTAGALAIFARQGVSNPLKMPPKYLWGCGLTFVVYEILLSQSIGLASSSQQVLEVGMLNYLWPCFIIVLSIWINNQRFNLLLWPGIFLSVAGIFWCIASGNEVTLSGFADSLAQDPVPYSMAFVAAILWGLYCNFSKRFGNTSRAIPWFFLATAAPLWVRFLASDSHFQAVPWISVGELAFIAVVFSISYSMWETGIQKGNMLLLAVLSYFTPVLSMLFACLWLKTLPPMIFWLGVLLVCAGSLLCWLATRNRAGEGPLAGQADPAPGGSSPGKPV